MHTGCWRAYQAEWTVINNEIYLTAIRSCCFYEDKIKADLSKLFPGLYKDGKVKADWINGKLSIQKGKLIYYIHQGFDSIYEKEIELTVENGSVIQEEEFDNSRSKRSIFTLKPDSLNNFIYSRIKWEKIPPLNDKKVRVIIFIKPSETGKPIVELYEKSKSFYAKEALRVAQLIPDWDILYRRGKPFLMRSGIPVVFSEENRKKYAKN